MRKKILKTLSLFAFAFMLNVVGMITVNAASGSVSVRSSSSKVVVGNNVTVTVTVSSTSAIGSWDCTLSYDSSKLTFVSSTASGQRMVGYGDGSKRSASYTFTFRAKASGTASVYISAASILDWTTEQEIGVTRGSTSISVITQEQLQASYSSNNNLASLSIDNATLSPAFNASTTSYTVELEPNTTSIKVNATAADSKSSISGAGIVNVVDGSNTINVVVTAENGKSKTYTINATVKELAPIEVKADGKSYTIARKEGSYQAPTSFEKTSIKIGNEDVLAYVNKKIGCTVVGLKDDKGQIGIYIYDSKTKKYSLYKNITVGSTNIYLKDLTDQAEVPAGYERTSLKIDSTTLSAWNYDGGESFFLIYGVNTESGEETFYLYDKDRATIQRFYGDQVNDLNDKLQQEKKLTMIVGGIGAVFILLTVFLLAKTLLKNHKEGKVSYKDSNEDLRRLGIDTDEVNKESIEESEENPERESFRKKKHRK